MRVSFARPWTVVVLCFSVVLGSGVRAAAGQSIAVTGRVVDAVSGRAVAGAQLAIGSRTVLTDADGQFRFDVAAGRWDIEVTARDYLPRTIAVEARSEAVAPIEIPLVPREGFRERLEVTAKAPKPEGPASMPLTPQQVLSPAGSLDNPFRTLKTLPGVVATDEFDSKLSVRGGAPDQNLTQMDGVEIHNPYRLFGLTSAFNPETMRSQHREDEHACRRCVPSASNDGRAVSRKLDWRSPSRGTARIELSCWHWRRSRIHRRLRLDAADDRSLGQLVGRSGLDRFREGGSFKNRSRSHRTELGRSEDPSGNPVQVTDRLEVWRMACQP